MKRQHLWVAILAGAVGCSAPAFGQDEAAQDAAAPREQPDRSATQAVEMPEAPAMRAVPYMGVAVVPATPESLGGAGLPEGVGLTVMDVAADSPAEAAGLQRMDVLQKLDDQVLINREQLGTLVRMRGADARVTLRVFREGEPRELELTIGTIRRAAAPAGRERLRIAPGEDDGPAKPAVGSERWVTHNGDGAAPGLSDRTTTQSRRLRLEALIDQVRRQPRENAARGGQLTHAIRINDGTHTLDIRTSGGDKQLRVTDAAGKLVFEGPINTADQRQAVPEDVRAKLDRLEQRAQAAGAPMSPPTAPTAGSEASPRADEADTQAGSAAEADKAAATPTETEGTGPAAD